MKLSTRLLLPAVLLSAPIALAESSAPTPQVEAEASSERVSVQFRGSLRDALQKIAEAGGLSVVVTGNLDTPAEVHLNGVSARQALRTVAKAYALHIEEEGGIFTLRPLAEAEKVQAAAPVVAPTKRAASTVAPVPPVPPIMPVPPMPEMSEMPELAGVDAEVQEALSEAMDGDAVRERLRERLRKVKRSGRGAQDVVARGRSLEVREGESVNSAVVYGGNLVVKGVVEDDAVAFGGNLEVQGHVEGDAHAFGGNVILAPGASVEGDVSSFGGDVIRQEDSSVGGSIESFGGSNIGRMVAGEIKRGMKEEAQEEAAHESSHRPGGGFASFVLWFATLFGLGFFGQLFFPARMKELSAEIKSHPLRNGAVGALGALALVPISVVLAVTLIGIPVAFALWVVAVFVTGLGFTAVASELGMRVPVLRGKKTQAVVLALGLLILLLVGKIPVVGPVVLVAATLVALGAIISSRFGYRPRGMPEPIIPGQTVP